MAPTYSRKKAKYSYSERVLGALSDLQKDHRKHAVHMATLRAHVRKAADARKDKMGPQWAQWVSRTVQRLVDDGILDTSDPHGNVSFTPNAKKTITAVRRESLTPGVAPSPNMEHKMWKDVTRRFSVVGVKRSRRRSSAVGAVGNDDVGDEGRPRKRQARKSFSKLTKSELETELRATLQRLLEAEEPQAADEEEVLELREELKIREQEVEDLRDQVARLKDHRLPDGRRVTIETASRLITPSPSNPSEPSSASTVRTTSVRRPRPSTQGVTRTLSGSLISNLSKRPTPEPSETGSHDDEVEDMIFDDNQEHPLPPASPRSGVGLSEEDGLITPRVSPFMMDDREDFIPVIDTLNRSAQGDEERPAPGSQLREQYQRLLAERDELRNAVASRDDRLAGLETEIQAHSDALKNSESRRVGFEESLHSEKARLQTVETALRASQEALEAERERYASLETEHTDLRGKATRMESEVSNLNLCSETLRDNIKEARSKAQGSLSAHLCSESKLQQANIEIANLKDELRSLQDTTGYLKEALEKSEVALGETRIEVQQTKAALVATEGELSTTTRVLDTTRASLSSRNAELEEQLKLARDHNSALAISKEDLGRTVIALQMSADSLRAELSHAKGESASAMAQLEESQGVIEQLRASHARALSDASTSTRDAAALKVTVSELESTVSRLRSQHELAAAEAADLRERLKFEEASRRRAESELVASVDARDKLVADVADKTAQLATTTEELRHAGKAADDARRQIETLEERREKDVAAYGAERSGLEAGLATARAEAEALKARVDEHLGEISSLSEKLVAANVERDELSVRLREAETRIGGLEEELSIALNDVRDAEEEIEELREAKAADEASVQILKESLVRLRQLQMDAVSEVDNKMISTRTAPLPGHRRRSSIAPRESVGRRG